MTNCFFPVLSSNHRCACVFHRSSIQVHKCRSHFAHSFKLHGILCNYWIHRVTCHNGCRSSPKFVFQLPWTQLWHWGVGHLRKSARRCASALGRAWRCFRYEDIDYSSKSEQNVLYQYYLGQWRPRLYFPSSLDPLNWQLTMAHFVRGKKGILPLKK
jgi:hypothetical protein